MLSISCCVLSSLPNIPFWSPVKGSNNRKTVFRAFFHFHYFWCSGAPCLYMHVEEIVCEGRSWRCFEFSPRRMCSNMVEKLSWSCFALGDLKADNTIGLEFSFCLPISDRPTTITRYQASCTAKLQYYQILLPKQTFFRSFFLYMLGT